MNNPFFTEGGRRRVTDDRTMTLAVRTLNQELTCPVCLGIIHDTMTVLECMHRFCSECIEKCLRIGKKECPACRVHVPSRRSLRNDPSFDMLISKIYPNLEEYEEKEEKRIADINAKHNMQNAFTASSKHGLEVQRIQRSTRLPAAVSHKRQASAALEEPKASATPRSSSSRSGGRRGTANSPKRRRVPPDHQEFVLRRHPTEESVAALKKELISTSKYITVSHLKQFLQMKLKRSLPAHLMIETHDGEEMVSSSIGLARAPPSLPPPPLLSPTIPPLFHLTEQRTNNRGHHGPPHLGSTAERARPLLPYLTLYTR